MKDKILKAIELSALAYKEPAAINRALHRLHHTYMLKHINKEETDTQGFILELSGVIWIVIRGTEFSSTNDWLTNLDCSRVTSCWGDVHSGFRRDAGSILEEVSVAVCMAQITKKQVVITGHSQGAAVAEQLLAMCAASTEVEHVTCISVEAPRSFHKEAACSFGQAHGEKIIQIVNNNDIVPCLPPTSMGFRHVSNASVRYINRKGQVKVGLPWYKKLVDRFLGYVRDIADLDLDCIGDHDVEEIARIWKAQM